MSDDPRDEARRRLAAARRELAAALSDTQGKVRRTQQKVERVAEPVRAVREKGWIVPAVAGAVGLGLALWLKRRR